MLLLALFVFSAATIRLFVLPAKDGPRRVDAVVVFGGEGDRLGTAVKLIREGYSSILLLSVDSLKNCPAVHHVNVVCFRPDPATTQGEARYLSTAARRHGWKQVIVVSSTPQDTRARLRIKRCTDLDVAYIPTSISRRHLPYDIVYEWGALFKALVIQRGC